MSTNGTRPNPVIVVCDGDNATGEFLADNLRADRYTVHVAETGQQAVWFLEHHECDLLVLDVALSDCCGFELCERIRSADRLNERVDSELPILIASTRGSEDDRIRGLRRGADDYIVKPFAYQELLARVQAIFRRTRGRPQNGKIRVGNLSIDTLQRKVRVGDRRVELSQMEFSLLRKLASEPLRVFTKEELLHDVWGYKLNGKTRTLDSHASRLRRKLNGGGKRYVTNIWGVGYRLVD